MQVVLRGAEDDALMLQHALQKVADRWLPASLLAAVAPWITSEGRRYAIADLRLLPAEVQSRVDVMRTFGHAAVIRERNATMKGCD